MASAVSRFGRILAHRGANREAPENTQDAFDKALSHAIDGLETDVQLSRDGIAVLWHDRSLDKLGLPERRIDDFDLATLKRLGTEAAQELMTLDDFIKRYRGRCILNPEIKIRAWETLARQQTKIRLTLQAVGGSKVDDVFISSFHLDSLIFAYRLNLSIPLFYLLDERHDDADKVDRVLREQTFLQGFCLPIGLLDAALVKTLRQHDKSIVAYTCNSEEEIVKALELKVDMLISDDLPQAMRLRQARRSQDSA
ncbi:MAG: glycerophosphodiester phosphodiesterase [Gammaproteobacteria bacterium HGW-Gammaproteobacteria-3]|nr:MAG: glycerophosphodiester phosphodiesterase [Gammaproteobacteria bacterium HGW-Gammaproteobacteria-3]